MCQALPADKILVIAVIAINEFLKGCCPEEVLKRHFYSSALPFPALGFCIPTSTPYCWKPWAEIPSTSSGMCGKEPGPSQNPLVYPAPSWSMTTDSDRNSEVAKVFSGQVRTSPCSGKPSINYPDAVEPWLEKWNAPDCPRMAFGRRGKEPRFIEHLYISLFNFHINSAREWVEPPGNFLFIGFLLYSKFPLWKISNAQKWRKW